MAKRLVILFFMMTSYVHGAHNVLTFFIKDRDKPKPVENLFAGITKKYIENKSSYHPKKVFVTYYGYVTLSDDLHQVTLPRKNNKTHFYMLVTNLVEPVLMFPNTISHWQIPYGVEAKMFELEQVYENKEYYWHVKPVHGPISRHIPLQTIIILAKPKNIVVPLGTFKTVPGNQLLLPDIFVKKDFNDADNALFMAKISKFFKPVEPALNKDNNLISNINI